jgi:anaerobic ribonucleoside-triphosphate reductase
MNNNSNTSNKNDTSNINTKHPWEKELGEGINFQRIRRITGYLVGSMDTWGSAKQAEEKDRVKHI